MRGEPGGVLVIPDDREERPAVEVRGADPAEHVRHARTRGDERDAGCSGELADHAGGERRRRLVMREEVIDAGGACRFVQLDRLRAGKTEDPLHAATGKILRDVTSEPHEDEPYPTAGDRSD